LTSIAGFSSHPKEREAAIDVGLAKYKQAPETFRHAYELQNVHMTGCNNYLFDLA
jgi:hypothetical protein